MKIHKELKQRSEAWLKLRASKISWTKLATVMAWPAAQKTLQYELLAETISPIEEIYTTEAMQRGIDLEPTGLYKTWLAIGKELTEVWLIEKDDFTILSPDSVVFEEDGTIKEAVELKCLAAKKQVRYMLMESFADVYKYEKQYYWQVVHYFLVIDTLEKVTFSLYNPDIWDKDKQLHLITVTRQELQSDIDKAEKQLTSFKQDFNKLKDLLNNEKK